MEESWVVAGFCKGVKELWQVLPCLLRDLSKDQLGCLVVIIIIIIIIVIIIIITSNSFQYIYPA